MSDIYSAVNWAKENLPNFQEINRRVRLCPQFASIKTVANALNELTTKSNSSIWEIADVISRDQTLTARLLRLVNSVYGGLSVKISNIEEAVFFLGLRQIRQLAMTTRIIEDMQSISNDELQVNWISVWRQSIATAILSREVLSMSRGLMDDDTYYLVGLLSDIGKIVMLNTYPDDFKKSLEFRETDPTQFMLKERAKFGFSHCDLGALYLEYNNLSPEVVEAVHFHHTPKLAPSALHLSAGVQVADYLARYVGFESVFEPPGSRTNGGWENLDGWEILFGGNNMEKSMARASIMRSLENIPNVLQGLL